ncbi:hypothetical protein L6164_012992 [Bauhinia variegata]|uniref:Uncharacterized protein n=1 Tax=Bauhinia variegata TaxID=167791 RepID=A0ACB9PC39_BAUVA|nr:hypothetical protein L6164_012992 [Bauhinia variegata]
MNFKKDDAFLRKIEKVEGSFKSMSNLVKNWEPKLLQHLANQRSQLNGHKSQNNIHSMLDHIDAEINQVKNTVSQLQKMPFPDESTSEDQRLELSKLEKKILEQDSAMKILKVSYDFIQDSHLKFCLVFLSIFPKNAVMRKRPLIYWWIGEGLITTEEKGEEIFEALLKLELITPYGNGKNPVVSRCRIHPWIRYLLIVIAKNAKLIDFDCKDIPRFDITNSKRACLVQGDEKFSHENESDDKILRTIFNVNESYVRFGSKRLANMEKLVVLQLGRWQDSPTHHIEVNDETFLKDLRTQKYLKYLSFRGISRITAIPDSMVELINLEILDLKACHNLETLPNDISPLKKLTHLDVSECYLLESMPKGLDKLTSLQVLKGFIMGNSKKTPCRIQDLQNSKKLKRLSIHIGSEAIIQKGDFQKLKDLESVQHLKISWGLTSEKYKGGILEDSFSFPPYLKKLDLEGFPYEQPPECLRPSKLEELKKLYIKGGKLRSLRHGEEDAWNVEILRLNYTKSLNIELEELRHIFPSLRYVQIIAREENNGEIKTNIFEWSHEELE